MTKTKDKLNEHILCSGFGGQGVMSMGMLLTYAGMIDDHEVSWLPSYGPEMRGGAANCAVIISADEIGSPTITTNATALIAMNLPSLEKFETSVLKDGAIFINSSIIDIDTHRKDVKSFKIPTTELAMKECESAKAANMVMLGAYMAYSHVCSIETMLEAFLKVFGEKKKSFIPMNKKALKVGADYMREHYKV